MLASGILDRVLDMGNPRLAARGVSWLLVRCSDRAGLLAEVANLISTHGHNIQVRIRRRRESSGTQNQHCQRERWVQKQHKQEHGSPP